MSWNDDRVEQLKKFWSEGLSASQIASKMGGVTRNAFIGKVHGLGRSGRAAPAKPQRGRSYGDDVEVIEPMERKQVLKPIVPEPEFLAPIVLDTGDLTTVATLNRHMCKWPIGDPTREDFHFCGQGTPAGKSYCAYHAQLAFQPAHKREPQTVQQRIAAERRRLAG